MRIPIKKMDLVVVLWLIIGACLVGWELNIHIHHRLLERNGIQAHARIVRAHMRNKTSYISYSFVDQEQRTFEREACVKQEAWMYLSNADKAPVTYLKGNPNWSMVLGESRTSLRQNLRLLTGIIMLCACGLWIGLGKHTSRKSATSLKPPQSPSEDKSA